MRSWNASAGSSLCAVGNTIGRWPRSVCHAHRRTALRGAQPPLGQDRGVYEHGASARLADSKSGPRTLWLGPHAVKVLTALPRHDGEGRAFHGNLTSTKLYSFWCAVRQEARSQGVRIHDAPHTYPSWGVMNGVGLTSVGRLLGHSKRATTAISAQLDDATLQGASAQAAGVIARAMGFRAEPPPSSVRPPTELCASTPPLRSDPLDLDWTGKISPAGDSTARTVGWICAINAMNPECFRSRSG